MLLTRIVLGIESSCDETAAAVYSEERGVISNVLFSQIELHKHYGGVVPEIASRAQLEKITSVIDEALAQACCHLSDIDMLAVTNRPGLPGSLLVGVCFAKAVAYALDKKILGINHLEAHAFSPMIEHSFPFPQICLTASGGHTALYRLLDFGTYELLGTTTDDAAGEAFDKVAKMLGYPYPGGPILEKLAQEVGFQDFFHYPRLKAKNLSWSFSGLKTAVLYDLVKKNAYDLSKKTFLKEEDLLLKQQVASSLLVCIGDICASRLELAIEQYPDTRVITFAGGVACNTYLRKKLSHVAHSYGIEFYSPAPKYCTDNAAMVAFMGHHYMKKGLFSDLTLDIL